MRDGADIDAELRLVAVVRQSIREQGGEPSGRPVDDLLDERGLSSGVHVPASDGPSCSVLRWELMKNGQPICKC
jgi:hypothetical protein